MSLKIRDQEQEPDVPEPALNPKQLINLKPSMWLDWFLCTGKYLRTKRPEHHLSAFVLLQDRLEKRG